MTPIHQHITKNRKSIIIVAGFLSGTYFLTQYVIERFIELQRRVSSDRAARENLRRRFEQNQQDANVTTAGLLPEMTNQILDALPVEKLTIELRRERNEIKENCNKVNETQSSAILNNFDESIERKSKHRLWNEVKIYSVTRTLTLVYSTCFLIMFTRLQLALLGRVAYINSVTASANAHNNSKINVDYSDSIYDKNDDFELSRRYLNFSWWIVHRGWRLILAQVQTAVEQVLGPITVRTSISLEEYSELLNNIRKIIDIENGESRLWIQYLLPPNCENELLKTLGETNSMDRRLESLLAESRDVLESPAASMIISRLLDNFFDVILNKLRYNTFANGSVKLASIAAGMSREAHMIANSMPNEYLSVIQNMQELLNFNVLVYSNYDDLDDRGNTSIKGL